MPLGSPLPVDNPQVGIYDAATIDVRLRLPDDLLLRGRDMHASFSRVGLGDMNITVGGELQIRKAPAGQPDLIGTVTVVRGFYDFQGRRFEVLRDSQIRFQGTRPIDPALQVERAAHHFRRDGDREHPRYGAPAAGEPVEPAAARRSRCAVADRVQPADQSARRRRTVESRRARRRSGRRISRDAARELDRARARSRHLRDPRIRRRERAAVDRCRSAIRLATVRVVPSGVRIGRLQLSCRSSTASTNCFASSAPSRKGTQRSHRTQRIDTTGLDLIYTLSY